MAARRSGEVGADGSGVLMTGGAGRLGAALRAVLPAIVAPDETDMDVTRPDHLAAALEEQRPAVFLHAAAYTDVKGAETARDACWRVNVEGTRNVVRALRGTGALLLHISTDYVFFGDRGGYREDDTPGPVRNYYALTKLVAEETARQSERHLIVRTSFRPRPWPYPQAFDDLFTSQDYVDVIAPEIARVVVRAADVPHTTLHVATERKSVYDLAVRTRPDVERTQKAGAGVDLPDDVSLDVSRWLELKAAWGS